MSYSKLHSTNDNINTARVNRIDCQISESQRHKAYKRMIKRGSASKLFSYNNKTIYLGSVTL